jgi:hypothetical protein
VLIGAATPRGRRWSGRALARQDAGLLKKRRRILPEGQAARIPAEVPAVVEPEGGVSGSRGEPLPLLPRNEPVVAAVNHQYRSGKGPHRLKAVEVIAQQPGRRPVGGRKGIERRERRLQDEGAQRAVPRELADRTAAERLSLINVPHEMNVRDCEERQRRARSPERDLRHAQVASRAQA